MSYSATSDTLVCSPFTRQASLAMATAEPVCECEVHILGFRARVAGPLDLVHAAQALFPAVPPSPVPPLEAMAGTAFHIFKDTRKGVPRPGWYEIVRGGRQHWATRDRADVLPTLEWLIIDAAVESLRDRYLLFHAGAVALNGLGLILPATSGSGKTTLVGGLLAAGFQYLSDEVAALAPGDWQAVPFVKSLCVKGGSRRILARWYPELLTSDAGGRFGGEPIWHIPPCNGSWPSAPIPVRFVVFPNYAPNTPTILTPISRSEALPSLLAQSLNAHALGTGGVDFMRGIIQMLQGATCYTLTVGSLDRAVDLLRRLAHA